MNLLARLVEWWKGKRVPMTFEIENGVGCIDGGYRIRPLPVRVLVAVGGFCRKYWWWIIPTIIALFSAF